MQRKRFILLLMVGLISVLAMGTILAKDHGNGNGGGNGGNGNPDPTVEQTSNGDNGNHHGGGNNGAGGGNGGAHGNGGQEQPQQEQPVQVQSTPAPTTSDGLLGCQKNNPSRLDCSSLDVSGVCQNNMAVFTIHNSGEAGNGDMRAPTEYRLVVDGVVVESGAIQLTGGSSTQITYSGGGTVTLEADQQIGHPGNSHPTVTLDCGPAEQTSTPIPTDTPTPEPTQEITPTVEAPVLTGEAFCKEDGSILFVVTNSGGDMLDSAAYTVSDENGTQIESGYMQLFTGEQSGLQYWGYTSLTLVVGDLVVIASPTCVPVTQEVTPTPEPTQEVTPGTPVLSVSTDCMSDGSTTFMIVNSGADMTEAVYYTVTDSNGALVTDGYVMLLSGEQFPLNYSGYPNFTLTVGDLVTTSPDCAPSTPEPTQEVTPPVLSGEVSCMDGGSIVFIITNSGGDMLDSSYYTVNTPDGGFVADGWLQLFTNEQARLEYWGYAQLTFTMGDLSVTQDSECPQPTPVPTEEVTPTPEPTQEVTPTPEPTQEVTPTAEPTDEVTPTDTPTETLTPTPAPTDDGTLGCQKNNPGRLDCSSLQVTGTCEDGMAVFTIRNMGKPGEGDMRAPTEYRIIVDGVVVESGTVQLVGGAGTQITYSGGGTVTLEADQQVGHPGKSQPQATVSCSA